MPADRLLETLLRSLQTHTDQQDTPRLLSTAASLLASLTNPLNVTLLTSQLLRAPALWNRPEGLRTCLRFLSLFHSATITVRRGEHDANDSRSDAQYPSGARSTGLKLETWIRAVVKGADERSQRWKHLMVIGGLLIGLEEDDVASATKSRGVLQSAILQATNLALMDIDDTEELGNHCITLVLNHAFPYLSDVERLRLDHDRLLPVLARSAFFSSEGFQSAYFLGTVDLDVVEVPGKKFSWPAKSTSFYQINQLVSRPLMSSMGPLSRLIAHSVESAKNSWKIQKLTEELSSFSRALLTQWRQNKLSEIDISEESVYLDQEAREKTLPTLWKLLKSALFATTIVLRGILGRLLADGSLAADAAAPMIVTQTLHTLRHLYFITSRLGPNTFSQYNFVYLTAMDVLTQYPIQADVFIKDIRPVTLGSIPGHPLDRCLDLYFLNTAEHFTLVLSPTVNEELLIAAANPYLAAGGNNNLLPIFEAAHSVMLAVFSAPQNASLASKHLPFYVDALFKVFPNNLSARQFRLAFKTLIRVTTPPSPLAASEPLLPAILLEILRDRAAKAPSAPLSHDHPAMSDSIDLPPLSEQAIFILTMLDALPSLAVDMLEEWLTLSAELIQQNPDEQMRITCANRLWELLVNGEMDAGRSEVCVAWWTTKGGREHVLFGKGPEKREFVMSGALQIADVESKL